eukprot:CAMPEP_0116831984 /NCGR_PEP_ID=MMETSP0418-20121206/5639_1 /TAXON_ID=1158023 /ORGANISM="Astrosyne radiata, Strain 13vi08-1A" /LENGTH=116 /DNA_ID=CAMNT_0004461293 /DNA_START=70 /DNA_END=421 /DNA_ORIENTATION=+
MTAIALGQTTDKQAQIVASEHEKIYEQKVSPVLASKVEEQEITTSSEKHSGAACQLRRAYKHLQGRLHPHPDPVAVAEDFADAQQLSMLVGSPAPQAEEEEMEDPVRQPPRGLLLH